MDYPMPTPDDVWEWIAQDTLPGLRPSTLIDYYRMINKVKADAWDEGYGAAASYHDLDTEFAAPNPYGEEN